jgi:hypothetical protein
MGEETFALFEVSESGSIAVEGVIACLAAAVVAPAMHATGIPLSGELELGFLDRLFEGAPDVIADHFLPRNVLLDVMQ